MAANLMTWLYKHGQTGRVLTGTLRDAVGPINLTNKTVTMYARRTKTSTPVINGAAVTKVDAANGRISYTLVANDTNPALVPENEAGYLLEFKLVDTITGLPDYVPLDVDGNRTYGRLVVQSNLD
jgi:hypothetical protein